MAKKDLTQLLQDGTLKPEQICPVVYTMSVIGQKWRIPILWHLADEGTLRYNEIKRGVVGITNIMLTQSLRNLEREWKLTLLERNRTGIKLTSDGSRLLPYAQNLCAEYQKLQMQVDDLHGVQSGIIRIGTFSSVATHWLPNIIKAFQKDYPGINNLQPRVHFTTWDDYAVMSMVESGLSISILPELILKRIPYRIVAKELDVPAYRTIVLALRDKKTASLAVKRFIEYLDYRNL